MTTKLSYYQQRKARLLAEMEAKYNAGKPASAPAWKDTLLFKTNLNGSNGFRRMKNELQQSQQFNTISDISGVKAGYKITYDVEVNWL